MNSYTIGLCAGIMAVMIWMVITKIFRKDKNGNAYDERQKIKRGEASSIAFFSMLIAELIVAIVTQENGQILMTPFMWHMSIIFFGATVFGLCCVWKDAYFNVTDNAKKSRRSLFISMGLILILSIIGSIRYGMENKFLNENGLLDSEFIIVIVCIMIALLLINITIKSLVDKKSEKED